MMAPYAFTLAAGQVDVQDWLQTYVLYNICILLFPVLCSGEQFYVPHLYQTCYAVRDYAFALGNDEGGVMGQEVVDYDETLDASLPYLPSLTFSKLPSPLENMQLCM